MKKIIILLLVLLGLNQILYFTKVQFICDKKLILDSSDQKNKKATIF